MLQPFSTCFLFLNVVLGINENYLHEETHHNNRDYLRKKFTKEENIIDAVIPKHQRQGYHEFVESRIVGGRDADIGKYPFFVSWGGCGASLVARDIILSAAHCKTNSETLVSIGQSRKEGSIGLGIERTITQKITHPKYNVYSIDYDYMVMKLDQPIELNDTVATSPFILLNSDDDIPRNNQDLKVIGFGKLSQFDSNTDFPSRLQEVQVKAIPTEDCNGYSNYDGQVNNETMFCAGTTGGGKDSCQGDSGGPMFYEKQPNIFVQVGIVSWGFGCAQSRYPGVYSRISGEIDWIKNEICNLSNYKPYFCKNSDTDDNNLSNSNNGSSNDNSNEDGMNSEDDNSTITIPGRLDIKYDLYSFETGWSLEENGSVFLYKATGDSEQTDFIQYRFNLKPGATVKFNITDRNGDGICCKFGNGGYEIYVETPNGDVLLTNGNGEFGYGEVKEFEVPSLKDIDAIEVALPENIDTPVPVTPEPISVISVTPKPFISISREPTRQPTPTPDSKPIQNFLCIVFGLFC